MDGCPKCESKMVVKNGHIHNGKQRYLCRDCGRQFVPEATKKVISAETKARVDNLLLEKIPLAGIARSVDVSEDMVADLCEPEVRKRQAVCASRH